MAVWPYNTARWERLRTAKKAEQPLCEHRETMGRIEPTTQIDHDIPISQGGDPFPPLDQLNALCPSCHSQKTNEDARGYRTVIGVDGWPIDRKHPAYRRG